MQKAEDYADIIMRDEREKILTETPTIYELNQIERIYKFHDGAVVKYEWQESPPGRAAKTEIFNHRFTLIEPPSPNHNKIETGIICVINYPQL